MDPILRIGSWASLETKDLQNFTEDADIESTDLDEEEGEFIVDWDSQKSSLHSNSNMFSLKSSSLLEMFKDCRFYFQHPYLRMFIPYFVMLLNIIGYAQDPIAKSYTKSTFPILGNSASFIFHKYTWCKGWDVFKVIMWISAVIFGIIFGKYVIHQFLWNKVLRLQIFRKGKGSFITIVFSVIISLYGFSVIYNFVIQFSNETMCGKPIDRFLISSETPILNNTFCTISAVLTWFGDCITACSVMDVMLQEKLYPKWSKPLRRLWRRQKIRLLTFWGTFLFATAIFVISLLTTSFNILWDNLPIDHSFNTKLWRVFLSAVILTFDLIIFMQDWEFPHFKNIVSLKLPGTPKTHIIFKVCKKKCQITGKWFNYVILVNVMMLDFNCWIGQLLYTPGEFGQYIDPDGRIHSVKDYSTLDPHNHSTRVLSYDIRKNTIIGNKTLYELDIVVAAFYSDPGLEILFGIIPVILSFLIFLAMFAIFGRYPLPSKENPYIGRAILTHRITELQTIRNSRQEDIQNWITKSPMQIARTQSGPTETLISQGASSRILPVASSTIPRGVSATISHKASTIAPRGASARKSRGASAAPSRRASAAVVRGASAKKSRGASAVPSRRASAALVRGASAGPSIHRGVSLGASSRAEQAQEISSKVCSVP